MALKPCPRPLCIAADWGDFEFAHIGCVRNWLRRCCLAHARKIRSLSATAKLAETISVCFGNLLLFPLSIQPSLLVLHIRVVPDLHASLLASTCESRGIFPPILRFTIYFNSYFSGRMRAKEASATELEAEKAVELVAASLPPRFGWGDGDGGAQGDSTVGFAERDVRYLITVGAPALE